MTNWREAAVRYQQSWSDRTEPEIATAPRHDPAIRGLQEFLDSPSGRMASELLWASRRYIVFGETVREDGLTLVYFLDGGGLRRASGPSGSSMAYSSSAPKPVVDRVTVQEAVYAAVEYGHRNPDDLLLWLHEELDKIADAAPKGGP